MDKNKIDIIIPAASKDISILEKNIPYISKNIKDFNYIYIITSNSNIIKINKWIKKYPFCKLIDENELIEGITFERIKKILQEHGVYNSYGWFFQQFLKMGFSLSKYCQDFYLSWDADTFPLNEILLFENNQPLYTVKREYHKPYFNTIKKLFGIERMIDHSFIAEHMLFKKSIMHELIDDIINSNIEGQNWYEKIIKACNFNESLYAFSEFETYGNYCMKKYPKYYKPRYLNTFREGSLIRGRNINDRIMKQLSFDLDTVSFELIHCPNFPWSIPYLFKQYSNRLKNKLQFIKHE